MEINRYKLYKNLINLTEFTDKYNWKLIRCFRWFKNIKKYQNLKDFVYIQWLYQTIYLKNKYQNFFDLVNKWTINSNNIEKFSSKIWWL